MNRMPSSTSRRPRHGRPRPSLTSFWFWNRWFQSCPLGVCEVWWDMPQWSSAKNLTVSTPESPATHPLRVGRTSDALSGSHLQFGDVAVALQRVVHPLTEPCRNLKNAVVPRDDEQRHCRLPWVLNELEFRAGSSASLHIQETP